MKGTNTLIINNEQMLEIIEQWWKSKTYSNMDKAKVSKVVANECDGFVITLEEEKVVEAGRESSLRD